MKKNVGNVDLGIRLVIGLVMLYIGLFDNPIVSSGTSKTIFIFLSLIPFVTGAVRICPFYNLVGINTACTKEVTDEATNETAEDITEKAM